MAILSSDMIGAPRVRCKSDDADSLRRQPIADSARRGLRAQGAGSKRAVTRVCKLPVASWTSTTASVVTSAAERRTRP